MHKIFQYHNYKLSQTLNYGKYTDLVEAQDKQYHVQLNLH